MSLSPIIGTSLFCEDMREEAQGTVSLIGVLPDTILLKSLPSALAKFCIYTRINFDPSIELGSVELLLRLPSQPDERLTPIDEALIAKAAQEAEGAPVAVIVSRIAFPNFVIRSAGRILCVMKVNGQEIVTGALNVGTSPSV